MFTQIMVPLDGSALAERALPCAERLARLTGATLHLVRVAGPVFESATDAAPQAVYADFLAAEMQAATAYLERVRGRLTAEGLAVRVHRVSGTIAGALLDYAGDAGIDLVVMCSHGRTGLDRFPLGSIADRLLHQGTTPLLLVRAFGPLVTFEHAVVPLDGSARAEAALGVVAELAQQGAVQVVTLLRVVQGQEEGLEAERYVEAVAGRLGPERLTSERQVTLGDDPARAIIEAAGEDKLVVLATHGRSGLLRWALGSVAHRVALGGAAGVLLVRAGLTPGTV